MAIDRISGVHGVRVEPPAGQGLGAVSGVVQLGGKGQSLAQQGSQHPISRDEIECAVHELNRMIEHVNQRLSFKIHEGSERMIVYVIDNRTNEVVREMPPEKFLDTIAKIREFVGLLFDEWF